MKPRVGWLPWPGLTWTSMLMSPRCWVPGSGGTAPPHLLGRPAEKLRSWRTCAMWLWPRMRASPVRSPSMQVRRWYPCSSRMAPHLHRSRSASGLESSARVRGRARPSHQQNHKRKRCMPKPKVAGWGPPVKARKLTGECRMIPSGCSRPLKKGQAASSAPGQTVTVEGAYPARRTRPTVVISSGVHVVTRGTNHTVARRWGGTAMGSSGGGVPMSAEIKVSHAGHRSAVLSMRSRSRCRSSSVTKTAPARRNDSHTLWYSPRIPVGFAAGLLSEGGRKARCRAETVGSHCTVEATAE
mmetsp:Transcript_17621/g.42484  ORF Transcript_17621/g.42484 Transcript_17621/m.42484 type:complete len:298 (-) Transcript_17621:80-973(-)